MFQQKQITWVLWRGTNLSKHDTGQERPLTVIMMCRLVLDGGPWWPHQEGALKPLYHDSTLMDVQVVEGQGRWRLESCRWGEDGEVIWGAEGVIYNSKYLQMQHISSRCRTWDNISMHDKAFNWTGHLWNKIKALCGEFSKPVFCDPWWFVLYMKQADDNSQLESNLGNVNVCMSKSCWHIIECLIDSSHHRKKKIL